jgi:hypothetical protein
MTSKTDLIHNVLINKVGIGNVFTLREIKQALANEDINRDFINNVISRFVAERFVVQVPHTKPYQFQLIAKRALLKERLKKRPQYSAMIRDVLNQCVGHWITLVDIREKLDDAVPIGVISSYLKVLIDQEKLYREKGYRNKYRYFVEAVIETDKYMDVSVYVWNVISQLRGFTFTPKGVYETLRDHPEFVDHTSLYGSVGQILRRWYNGGHLIRTGPGLYKLKEGVISKPLTTVGKKQVA